MNVAKQIEILKTAITHLERHDPDSKVFGHISYPEDGCGGDLENSISMIDVEYEEEGTTTGVVLGIHY